MRACSTSPRERARSRAAWSGSTAASVVGVDQSPQMLDGARERIAKAGLADRIELRLGSAGDARLRGGLVRRAHDRLPAALPRRSAAHDDDLLRLIRPGAPFALLDFAVPPNVVARGLWHLYTGVGLPVLGRLVSPGWAEVGRYLRPSITAFGGAYPPTRCATCWSRRAEPTCRCAG